MFKKLCPIAIFLLIFTILPSRSYAFQVSETKTLKISPLEDSTVMSPEPVEISVPLPKHRLILVGYLPKEISDTPLYGVRKALFAFNLSDIPENAVITSANLRLYYAGSFPSSTAGQTHFMHLLRDNWNRNAVYDDVSNMAFDSESVTTFYISHGDGLIGPVMIDVVNIVKRAKEINYLPDGNLNLLITGNVETDSPNETVYFSKDCNCPEGSAPYLEVTYVVNEQHTNSLDLNDDGAVNLLDLIYLVRNL